MLTQANVSGYIIELIKKKALWKFYKTPEWIALKEQVLRDNHYECTICKSRGKITRYDMKKDGSRKLIQTVHHVKYVKDHPELALTRSNLIPVCKACHNKIHEAERNGNNKKKGFITPERW